MAPSGYRGLLCFDFDGTLHSSFDKLPVSEACLKALKNLSDAGYAWGINTGRDFDYLMEGVEESNFPLSPDFIITREREVYWFDSKLASWVADPEWLEQCDKLHEEVFSREKEAITAVERFVRDETQAEWVSMPGDLAGVIATSLEEIEEIMKQVRLHTDHIPDLSYLRSTIYMRFTHAEYHKGSSLQYVCKKLGVATKDIFVMGDGENDLGMLDQEVAAMIACPENAVYEVKRRVEEVGGFIAGRPVSDGVMQALNAFYPELVSE